MTTDPTPSAEMQRLLEEIKERHIEKFGENCSISISDSNRDVYEQCHSDGDDQCECLEESDEMIKEAKTFIDHAPADIALLLSHIHTLESKLEASERDNVKTARALALANSMILSGEQHSETSEIIIRDALSRPTL